MAGSDRWAVTFIIFGIIVAQTGVLLMPFAGAWWYVGLVVLVLGAGWLAFFWIMYRMWLLNSFDALLPDGSRQRFARAQLDNLMGRDPNYYQELCRLNIHLERWHLGCIDPPQF